MDPPGYWIIEEVFSDAECDRTLASIESVARPSRAGARNLMSIPEISQIAQDARLLAIGQRHLNSMPIPFKATLFAKTGKANWLVAFHQDTALPLVEGTKAEDWGPVSKKQGVTYVHAPTWALSQILALRINLDASTSANGPLRVIPNSHHKRLRTDDEFNECLTAGSAVECITGRGGVIAMSPLIVHASSKSLNNKPRRVLHIEYARSLDLSPGIRLAIS